MIRQVQCKLGKGERVLHVGEFESTTGSLPPLETIETDETS